MTLPDERYRAIVQTRQFLLDVCSTNKTPRVPKLVREHARAMLRHYPSDWEVEQLAQKSPDILQKQMEELHKLLLQHREKKQNANT